MEELVSTKHDDDDDDDGDSSSSSSVCNTVIILVAHGDVLQILQTGFEKMDGSRHRTHLPHLETAVPRHLRMKQNTL